MFVHCSNSSSNILTAVHKTPADIKRCQSERDCHRSTTTQLWNADMSTSSNHTKAFVQRCHGKHMVASSRTLLCDHVIYIQHINVKWYHGLPSCKFVFALCFLQYLMMLSIYKIIQHRLMAESINMEHQGNEKDGGNWIMKRKTCCNATCPTKTPHRLSQTEPRLVWWQASD